MIFHRICTIALLIGLLPVSILGYGSTPETIVESILESLPSELANLTLPPVNVLGSVRIIKIGNLSRACPTAINEITENGIQSFEVSTCLNVEDAVIDVPERSVTASIGRARFDVFVKFIKSVKSSLEAEISIPVWEDIEVEGPYLSRLLASSVLRSSSLVRFTLQTVITSVLREIKWDNL
ncbi:unnamed protein product [Mesocestoides corti]|uniref:Secreted protein n=1 Tax=Mesocestoides corti TaxID=53468 RepID=A0A0R3ULP9_MESCO|nr:unnamed protein product [Mesocestoides corti]